MILMYALIQHSSPPPSTKAIGVVYFRKKYHTCRGRFATLKRISDVGISEWYLRHNLALKDEILMPSTGTVLLHKYKICWKHLARGNDNTKEKKHKKNTITLPRTNNSIDEHVHNLLKTLDT